MYSTLKNLAKNHLNCAKLFLGLCYTKMKCYDYLKTVKRFELYRVMPGSRLMVRTSL